MAYVFLNIFKLSRNQRAKILTFIFVLLFSCMTLSQLEYYLDGEKYL